MRRTINFLVAFVLLFSLLGVKSFASDRSSELSAAPGISLPLALTPFMRVLEDASKTMAVEEVMSEASQQRFKSLNGRALNSGLSQSAFWVAVDLPNEVLDSLRSLDHHWLVELDTPYINQIDFYLVDLANNLVQQHWQTGDIYPYKQRPVPTTNFVFPIDLHDNHGTTILIRLQNDGLVIAKPKLWQIDEYYEISDNRSKLAGLFYGAMTIMALYNFIIFLSIRDRTYLYYVLSIIGITLFEACNRGDAFKYIWPDAPQYPNTMLSVSVFFAEVFTLLFFYKFLQLDRYMKPWGQLVKSSALACAAMLIIAIFIPNRLAINIASGIAMMLSVLAIYIGVARYRMGSRSAKLFLIAWSVLLIAVFITAAMRFVPMPVNSFTTNLISVGLSLEVSLLSLALADKFNRLQTNAQTTLHDALQKLEKSNLVKDQFLSTISHELRTPMNGIEGSLSLVNKDELSDVDKLYLSTAASSAKDMTAMIDALLRFNEMQAGSIVLKSEPFNPVSFFNGIALDIEERCRRKQIQFTSDTPGSALVLKGDPEQLKLVLIQLADNAVKYTPPEGKVELKVFQTVSSGWASLVMRLQDTGIGMSEDIKERMFQPFSSVASNAKGEGGLGIGLTLCRYLVEKMGGTIIIESTPDKGTRAEVVLHLPILAHQAQNDDVQDQPLNLQQNILIVEDNPVNQQVMKGILSKLGYHSMIAGNGQEAVEMVGAESIDFIFMDCQMPVMDGYEATHKIRKELGRNDLPIIAVTANAMSTDKDKCLKAGMNDYLAKPIQIDQIRKILLRWNS
ncbi:MAG: response regulator [Pseudomonadales bacterium]|nr:response regulator [Pseudomonadales bacterium]